MTTAGAIDLPCDTAGALRIGVVIPARDEEHSVAQTIRAVRTTGRAEIVVVVDSASTDRTAQVAARAGAIVTGGPAIESRAAAMNAGAARALADVPDLNVLWFVHADCRPVVGWDKAMTFALRDERTVAGAFGFEWDLVGVPLLRRLGLHAIALINRVRMRLTRNYYGDQGMFIRADAFREVGGFPDVPLMEDLLMSRRLKRCGRVRLARGRMTVSPRRFLRHGVIRQAIIDAFLLVAERFGVKPHRLHAWYNREKA